MSSTFNLNAASQVVTEVWSRRAVQSQMSSPPQQQTGSVCPWQAEAIQQFLRCLQSEGCDVTSTRPCPPSCTGRYSTADHN